MARTAAHAPPLDAAAWEKLLSFLSVDAATPAARGNAYEAHRQRLESFFRWRGLSDPQTLADETLDRVGRKLAADEVRTTAAASFLLGVARLVALEAGRREQKEVPLTDRAAAPALAPEPHDGAALAKCLRALGDDERAFILAYHQHDGRARIAGRQALAERLGVSASALRLRAFRLRQRLEACLRGAGVSA